MGHWKMKRLEWLIRAGQGRRNKLKRRPGQRPKKCWDEDKTIWPAHYGKIKESLLPCIYSKMTLYQRHRSRNYEDFRSWGFPHSKSFPIETQHEKSSFLISFILLERIFSTFYCALYLVHCRKDFSNFRPYQTFCSHTNLFHLYSWFLGTFSLSWRLGV